MKIHTDLTERQLRDAFAASGVPSATMHVSVHGSRSRSHRLDVSFVGEPMKGRRTGQTGQTGIAYDEWGLFIQQVLLLEPDAVVGPYDGMGEFRHMTDWRYDDLTWADRCIHRWEYITAREVECPRCGAIKRDRPSIGFTA